MSFNPYVFFSGNCAEAFARYHEIFGGELSLMTHGDMPPDAEPMPGATPEMVMHASIEINGGFLMGSDDPTGDDGPKTGVAVSFTAPDPDTGAKVFAALCEGGEEQMPFEATFWSPGFGTCVDRFGVSWMVDTVAPEAG
jgi:PhnB protein